MQPSLIYPFQIVRPSLKAYRLTGWRSTSSVLNLTKGKKTLLFCKYLFTLQSCFKNMRTSLEQVNKPSYGMVTKAQQQTRLIRLTLTEIVRHTIKCSFIKMNLLALVYVISNSKQFFPSMYLHYHWALTGAHRVDRSRWWFTLYFLLESLLRLMCLIFRPFCI